MTRVYCTNYDCMYCEGDSQICCASMIVIGDDKIYGCENYRSYLDTTEYNEEFYKLIGEKGKPIGRERSYGKKIVYNDRIFYTTEKSLNNTWAFLTDAKTGLGVKYQQLEEKWDKFLELISKQPDIETFPIIVKDSSGKWQRVEGGADNAD